MQNRAITAHARWVIEKRGSHYSGLANVRILSRNDEFMKATCYIIRVSYPFKSSPYTLFASQYDSLRARAQKNVALYAELYDLHSKSVRARYAD